MDDLRFGSTIRMVRIRKRLTQDELSKLACVSRGTVSRIERGHLDQVSLASIRAVAKALDVRVDLVPRWRGGDLDRLLNSRHSALHEQVARSFAERPEWLTAPEVSFAIYSERGVIDILAWHAGRQMLLVIELKTDIVDVNELLGTLDRKRHLAWQVARERGWDVRERTRVSLWVIVAESRTNRAASAGPRRDASRGAASRRPIDLGLAPGSIATRWRALFLARCTSHGRKRRSGADSQGQIGLSTTELSVDPHRRLVAAVVKTGLDPSSLR